MTAAEMTERTHALVEAGGLVYAARQTGLYQFGADGEWQSLYQNWQAEAPTATLAVAVDAESGQLLAGIHGGVARSTDMGKTWQAEAFRAPPPLVTCLAPVCGDTSAGILAGTFQDGVFRSSDGGRTWRAHNHGLFDHSINCLAHSQDFVDSGVVLAGASSGIYRSENGGRLWQDLPMPAGDEVVLSLALAEHDRSIYAGTETHGLLRSDDSGENWASLLDGDGAVNAIALAADGSLITQVDDRALRLDADSADWNAFEAGGVDCLTLDESGAELLLAMSDGSLRRLAL